MADILLAAVNARYNHTNIAVRSLALYSRMPGLVIFDEWTINQPELEILRGIAEHHPKIILFSTYIWNIDIVLKIVRELPKIIPGCIIGAGGPEAGYRARHILSREPEMDIIIEGEGEQTTAELAELYQTQCDSFNTEVWLEAASCIPGVYVKTGSGKNMHITYGGLRNPLPDLNVLPFPYPEITDPENRIYYYESSRGCPFSCAYCMSSLDKHVRFMPLERVFRDLQRFLDAGTALVKFVDRTYNLEPERYIKIWKYICAHHNGVTMFHFEIEAEYLCAEALDFLRTVPAGIMQFEIGIQTTNTETLKEVHRSPNVRTSAENIRLIPKTIHTHLDLIAGLPYEGLDSFGHSFDWTLALTPDALQLGFLKVLAGTPMESYCLKNGWKWMSDPPYEVLSTPYLSYDDIQFLKDIELLLDVYWNSHNFDTTIYAIQKLKSLWEFFCKLTGYCRKQNAFTLQRKPAYWYEIINNFFSENFFNDTDSRILHELLRFDFISTGKKGNFPVWCEHNYNKEAHREALEKHTDFASTRTAYSSSEYDEFIINPLAPQEHCSGSTYKILFVYLHDSDGKTTTILM
ncbi:MAG: B12-binding domain-containing radical SAM protein [Treponema sp.]|nr:B12-binding domain-containing radical SAM protein [Treponema sp.]